MQHARELPNLSLDERICLIQAEGAGAIAFGPLHDNVHSGLVAQGLLAVERRMGEASLLAVTPRGRLLADELKRAFPPRRAAGVLRA